MIEAMDHRWRYCGGSSVVGTLLALVGCTMPGLAPLPGVAPQPGGACASEPDCALGQACTDGMCVATSAADLQYLVVLNGQTAPVSDGGDIPVFSGVQGGIHTLITLRSVGIPTMAVIDSVIEITLASTGAPAGATTMPNLFFNDVGGGIGEAEDIFVTLSATADPVGQDGLVTITVTTRDDPPVSATLVQRVRFVSGRTG